MHHDVPEDLHNRLRYLAQDGSSETLTEAR
jgi:hypothetical protein